MTQVGTSGRCLCGAVSYTFQGEMSWTGYCHFDDCRRNCAAPVTMFFGIDNGKWEWTGAKPGVFQSSADGTRYFCPTCGTPMAYTNRRYDYETHFYAATLDDPTDFTPQQHFHYDEKLPWLPISDDLKKHEMNQS